MATMLWLSGARAQGETTLGTDEQLDRSVLAEIVVTARRREENLQSVPVAVTLLNAETIENRQIENFEDLQTVVPALSVSGSSGRPNQPVYGLRGIRPTEPLYGQDPTVAVYFADVVLAPAEGSNLGIYDIESVQILKGPQGTLFGRNTTGGAILFTPRRPSGVFGGNVTAGFGNYGRTEVQLGIDLPVTDTLALRIAARAAESDGYQTNVAPGPLFGAKLGGEDSKSARISAVWDITENVENYTILSWDEKDNNGRAMVLEAVNPNSAMQFYNGTLLPSIFDALARAQSRDVHSIESDMRQYDQIEAWSVINTTTAQLGGDLTLKSIAAYRDFQTNSTFDIDSTAIPGILTAGSNVPGVLSAPEQTVTLEHASYELQLLGKAFRDRLDWVVGLYGYYEEGYQFFAGDVLRGINPNNPFLQKATVENLSYSAFAQGTYALTPKMSLTIGGRWTYDDKEMTVSTLNGSSCALQHPITSVPLPANQCAVDLSASFDQPTGTVSLDYKVRDDLLVYVASRYGYRAGGLNMRAARPVEYRPFDAETVLDLELGTKADWSAGAWRMRTNIAVYQQWYDDIQRTVNVLSPGGVPNSAIQNAAKAEVFGIELEQTIQPTPNLSLQINYSYTDPKYEDWTEPATGVDLSDTPFAFTPKHSGSAQLSYKVPLAGEAGTLRFSAGASYKGDHWLNALNDIRLIRGTPPELRHTLKQKAYWLFDLGAGWSGIITGVDVSVFVKNVTDEEYSLGGVFLYPTFGINTKAYAPPRTYGVEVRYSF